ncbi:MAG: hypothetical protein JNL50_12450 [Phycisphaerae bacterium]|nr:hypothetical protein [Phycisphaerae bacterium]
MSERVRNGLGILDAVLTFGVDGLAEQKERSETLFALGLTTDVFWNELYIHRPGIEKELVSKLESGALHTVAVGSIGCGKSTLLHYALREYCSARGLPPIVIDFKTENKTFPTLVDVTQHVECQIIRQISLSPELCAGPHGAKSGFEALLRQLLDADGLRHVTATPFRYVATLQSMQSLAGDDPSLSLWEWIERVRSTKDHILRPRVIELVATFAQSIGALEYAYAFLSQVRAQRGASARPKLVVAFDNTDQIDDLTTREMVLQWMCSKSLSYSSVVTFVTCIRPQNLPYLHAADASGMFGDDPAAILKLDIAPIELSSEDMREWQAFMADQRFDPNIESNDLSEFTPAEIQQMAFDDLIHKRRIDFAARVVSSGRIQGVAREDLEAVSQAAQEIQKVGSVARDIRMQANNNRRVMLAGISNLLEYIVKCLALDWASLGSPGPQADHAPGARERRANAIRSLYFRFLGSSPEPGGQFPVFDCAVFDPVASILMCGWRGRQMIAKDSKEVATACRPLLVMLAVFNACGNTRRVFSDARTTVSSVVAECAGLGLSETDVREVLHDIIRTVRHRFAGMFEIEHYVSIRERRRDVALTDRIVATPRCFRLISFAMFMTNYLCERLFENHVAAASDPGHQLARRGLIAPDLVADFPYWVAKAGVVECWWIEALHRNSGNGHKHRGVDAYLANFSVKESHGAPLVMLTQRMARSGVGYLEQAIPSLRRDEGHIRNVYHRAVEQLRTIDNVLEAVVSRLRSGEPWGIPRDRAIEI